MPREARKIALWGAGGFVAQIIEIAEANDVSAIIDDNRTGDIFGIPICGLEDIDPAEYAVAITVADPATRKLMALRGAGLTFTSLFDATARVSRHAEMGLGAILCYSTLIEAGARIGKHFHGNIYSYVAHDCVIGDYVTFAPRVNCNGAVRIGDGVYVGTGAFLRQGITIGEGATIGMGAVVTADVRPHAVMMGNPARERVQAPPRN